MNTDPATKPTPEAIAEMQRAIAVRRTDQENRHRQAHQTRPEQKGRRFRKLARPLDRETRPLGLGRPMNPNKLDVTKLDEQAAELGYCYRRGIQRGAGYIVADDISGDMPFGEKYTAPLKAVKEYLDNVAKQLKAKALGYSYERDFEDRDGYVLIEDATGEIVLGDGYTATLKDIRAFLDNVANDLGVEVEVVTKRPKVKPPSPQKLAAALRGHADAKEIKAMAKSANVNLKPKITSHDLNLEVRALKSRDEHKPNWINPDGLHDRNEHDEADDRDLREYLKDVERQNKSFTGTRNRRAGFRHAESGRSSASRRR